MLRSDLESLRDPSDGGGRAWLEGSSDETSTTVSMPGRWVLNYAAGPEGIDPGGTLFFQVSPFWGWSTPQVTDPQAPGYTEASTNAEGVRLESRTLGRQLLGVTLHGRRLEPGERIRLVYGAGSAGAVSDRYAEKDSHFWIAVDGDGDGVRALINRSPSVEMRAGPPSRLVAFLPSTVKLGKAVRLTVAVLDEHGNVGCNFAGTLHVGPWPERVDEEVDALPTTLRLESEDRGIRHVDWVPKKAGIVRLRIESSDGSLAAVTNPMQVATGALSILWGDLQNHSNLSDGTGRPEDLIDYGRDVAVLDVVAVTDHDHWGMRFLDQDVDAWRHLMKVAEEHYEPGRFVTLPGFEWTNWIYGHRHVLFFDGSDARLISSIDPETDHPEELWHSLEGLDAMTIAHHSAGGPISQDWSVPPPPELEPVTEIVSVHGASEAADAPHPIAGPVDGNFVRNALARGYRFGFIGSSDGHDGHPGLAHLAGGSGGLVAIVGAEPTRESVAEALRKRRVYATNGPRILLRVVYGGWRMGAAVPVVDGVASQPPGQELVPGVPSGGLLIQAVASTPIERIEVVRGTRGDPGGVSAESNCGEFECVFVSEVADAQAGGWLYVRVLLADGGAAWSSPFYFVDGREAAAGG